MGTVSTAAEGAAPGKLEGFNGALLFPMVIAGWLLIAFVALGLVYEGGGSEGLALLLFLCVLIGPTLLVYRSMYPARPLDEWLGSRDVGRVGVPLAIWFVICWLVWSITTWTTFVGSRWTTFCEYVLYCLVLVLPLLLIRIQPRGGRRLFEFLGIATVVGLISVGAYVAGLTPVPRWPRTALTRRPAAGRAAAAVGTPRWRTADRGTTRPSPRRRASRRIRAGRAGSPHRPSGP